MTVDRLDLMQCVTELGVERASRQFLAEIGPGRHEVPADPAAPATQSVTDVVPKPAVCDVAWCEAAIADSSCGSPGAHVTSQIRPTAGSIRPASLDLCGG